MRDFSKVVSCPALQEQETDLRTRVQDGSGGDGNASYHPMLSQWSRNAHFDINTYKHRLLHIYSSIEPIMYEVCPDDFRKIGI
jgi:hypothetical protein